MVEWFKIFFLFLAIWWMTVNATKAYYKESIPAGNFLIMTLGIVGFIVLQFHLIR